MFFKASDFKPEDAGKRIMVCNKSNDILYQGIYHGTTFNSKVIAENITNSRVDLIDFQDEQYTFAFNSESGIETNFAFWDIISRKYQFMAVDCGWHSSQKAYFCNGNMIYNRLEDSWSAIRKEDIVHEITINELLDIIDNPLLSTSDGAQIKFNYKNTRPETSCIKRID